MAKKAWLERNKKKQETVKKYAAIRANAATTTYPDWGPPANAAWRSPVARS